MPLGILGGTLLASALQGIFGIGSTIAANKYNSPAAMKKRLRQAGLPLSYMYQGKVATQSDVPKLSIDPTLGVVQQKKLTQDQPLVDANVARVKSETKGQDISNDVANAIRDWQLNQGKTGFGMTGANNLEINLNTEQYMKHAARFAQEHKTRLLQIQRIVENTLFSEGVPQELRRQALTQVKENIKKLGLQSNLLNQMEDIRDFDQWLNSTITDTITSLPKWAQALTATLLKLQSYR